MKSLFKHLRVITGILAVFLLVMPLSGLAASYPTKPIQLVVSYPPGGGNDLSARIIAEFANKHLPQPLVVTNISGGTGTIGARHVLRAKPDGYTLFWEQPTMSCQTASGIVDYSYRDFDMINVVVESTAVCAVNKKLPVKTAPELMEYMRKNPGKVRWPLSFGALSHFLYLYLENGADGEATVPGRVGNAGDIDRFVKVMGGHADATCAAVSAVMPYKDDLTIVGVANAKRLDVLPDIPTFREQGIDAIYNHLYTLFAPKGTPEDVKKILSEAMRKAVEDPECQAKLTPLFLFPNYLTPEEGAGKWEAQENINKQIVEKYNLKEQLSK